MFIKRPLFQFSHDFYHMHEFQQAQTLMNNNAFSQAHDLFLRLIQILKPHGRLPNDLLSISYQNALKIGPKQQNDILQYKLDTLGNVLKLVLNYFFKIPFILNNPKLKFYLSYQFSLMLLF